MIERAYTYKAEYDMSYLGHVVTSNHHPINSACFIEDMTTKFRIT